MMKKPELAIVLPAWKSNFLEKSLQSLENQTSPDFRLYIFDDAGPPELFGIIEPFLQRNPDWKYQRFDSNLGGENLAAHWNRCIGQTEGNWIWLFSDDDEMEPDCVEAFHASRKEFPGHQVYRFPFSIMDEEGNGMAVKSFAGPVLNGAEFGRLRFLRQLDSSAVEFIFSRESFENKGGFPEFPAGWCADDAAWISFSGSAGIRCIDNGGVRWRWSPLSISGSGGRWTKRKLEAALVFIKWYNATFPEVKFDKSFLAEQVIWLRLQMVHAHHLPGFFDVLKMIRKLEISGIANRLRCFQDLFCLSYVYRQRVVLQEKPSGIRYWLSLLLPAF